MVIGDYPQWMHAFTYHALSPHPRAHIQPSTPLPGRKHLNSIDDESIENRKYVELIKIGIGGGDGRQWHVYRQTPLVDARDLPLLCILHKYDMQSNGSPSHYRKRLSNSNKPCHCFGKKQERAASGEGRKLVLNVDSEFAF